MVGQIAVGVRYGQGEGSANYHIGEINGRAHVIGRFHLMSTFQLIGGTWGCASDPIEDIRCGYDGHSISLGGALAAVDHRNAFVALTGSLGAFVQTGSYAGYQYSDHRHLTGSVGMDADVAVWGPVRLQGSVAHRRIFDETYQRALGKSPHFTGFTAGLLLLIRSRRGEN